jgi:glycosyltransferase involved in cell wall biosynthesis
VVFLDALSGAVLAMSLAKDLNLPLVYRSQNVQYQYMKALFMAERKKIRKAALFLNIWRDKAVERHVRSGSSRVYDIASEDRDVWQEQTTTANSRVLNYFLHPDTNLARREQYVDEVLDGLFVGNLHTPNNVFGLGWFAKNVAPLLGGLRIVVAGAKPTQKLRNTLHDARIEVIADPEEVQYLYDQARVLINPVHHSSGVNVKMIETLSTGKPVVSTSAGTRGLAKPLLPHVGVADDPEGFAKLILERVSSGRSRRQQDDVIREYSWENVTVLIEDLKEISGAK